MRFDVEIVRILSAIGIVWFHSGIIFGSEFSYSGLICFVIFSSYFSAASYKRCAVKDRFVRLIIPCIIWSIFYGFFKYIRGVEVFGSGNFLASLLATPAVHLWYLPYIFFLLVIVDFLKVRLSPENLGMAFGFCAVLMISAVPIWRYASFGLPWDQYLHALPAALFGVFLACFWKIKSFVRVSISCVFLSVLAWFFWIGLHGIGVPYLVGAMTCLILLNRNPIVVNDQFIRNLSSATFGVYLIHPLFIFVFRHYGVDGWLLPITSAFISFLFVMLARNYLPRIFIRYFL